MSAEAVEEARQDEVLAALSRGFDMTSSPWMGLHYTFEDTLMQEYPFRRLALNEQSRPPN